MVDGDSVASSIAYYENNLHPTRRAEVNAQAACAAEPGRPGALLAGTRERWEGSLHCSGVGTLFRGKT
ncbi:hypothetical protein [Sphaerisporangium sp. NPDC051011]|uniref:hypothetical protein n=1 Tax=Sphaerisporangium sp. NPDC051011 TaxID=3155792 RepID=UPI00340DCCF0